MNNTKMQELNTLFTSLQEARDLNLSKFPYHYAHCQFNLKLKEYLKEQFRDNIEFDREETFAYVQAHYKGVGIEINTYEGIILTIEDSAKKDLVDDFKEIFTKMIGMNVICSYHYCSRVDDIKTDYPTVEWSLNPDKRLYELVMKHSILPGEWLENFEDYYTSSIIQSLGEDLFTVSGYQKLFNKHYSSPKYILHKVRQIQKLNPNLKDMAIYEWIDSAKERIILSEEVTFQKKYMDDGK